jgi:2-dehydropantoate 2-reductase
MQSSKRVSSESQLHVAIVGAGTIGCYIGGRLSDRMRVTYIGRPRIAAEISESGLTVSDFKGFHRYIDPSDVSFQTHISAAADADLVLVTVKSGATAEVAKEIGGVLTRPSVIVSLQNGLHNAEVLSQNLPTHSVLAGMIPFNVVHRAPAIFHQGSAGALMVQADSRLAQFLEPFRSAGLALTQRNDMPSVQRAKLLLNLNNAINALSDLPLREQLAQRDWRLCLALAQREALKVFAAAGLTTVRLGALPPRWMPNVLSLPDRWFRFIAARLLAIDPLARSSTWEDLQAGRRTEVDAIQGEVTALAAAHGLSAPVNARLLVFIRDAEQRRSTLTGASLLAELQIAHRLESDS